MPSPEPRLVELLAPARDADVALAAIDAGADAIYIGAPSHGARSQAGNSLQDLERVVNHAHRYGVRVYATVNTLVYDHETEQVERLARDLYRIGVDALIVQDLGLLEMPLPPIDLHASTQCDIREPEKALFLRRAGFSRVVVAREMGTEQIQEISQAPKPVPEVEAFCHGALCVSYSGDCRASLFVTGRSANRGECAQMCRLSYDLVNEQGQVLARQRHFLSLRDMNRLDCLGRMIDAGVSSFKIEGRLKDASYVVNAVAAYRRALDREMAARKLRRSSHGTSHVAFHPDVAKEFNRGFTDYFLKSRAPSHMASFDSPAFVGQPVGTVVGVDGTEVRVRLRPGTEPIGNGDGLTFFDSRGTLQGFRVNRAEGERLMLRAPVASLKGGTQLYRNYFKEHADAVERPMKRRTIDVSLAFRLACGGTLACLDATDERGCSVTATVAIPQAQPAVTPQVTPRRRLLNKTGDTIYRVAEVSDLAGDMFVPASCVTALRRRALELLDQAARMTYRYRYRLPMEHGLNARGMVAANVANRHARQFYEKCGLTDADIEPAAEVQPASGQRQRVMTCRYCLRRELGQCLRQGAKPEKWFLQAPGLRFSLDFDCKRCMMNVYAEKTAPGQHTDSK